MQNDHGYHQTESITIITAHLIIDISSNSAELSRPFTRPQRDVVLAPKFWSLCLLWGNPNTRQIQIDQKYKYMKYTNAWKIQIDGNTKTYVIMAVPFYIRVCSQSKLFSMHHEAITCTNINSEEDDDGFTLFLGLSYNNIFKYRMIIIYTIFCLTFPESREDRITPLPRQNVYTGTLFIENVQMRIW